jgi:hypothetical protein
MSESEPAPVILHPAPESAQAEPAASPSAKEIELTRQLAEAHCDLAEQRRLLGEARAEIREFDQRLAKLQADHATILDLVNKREQLAAAIESERSETWPPGSRSRPQ